MFISGNYSSSYFDPDLTSSPENSSPSSTHTHTHTPIWAFNSKECEINGAFKIQAFDVGYCGNDSEQCNWLQSPSLLPKKTLEALTRLLCFISHLLTPSLHLIRFFLTCLCAKRLGQIYCCCQAAAVRHQSNAVVPFFLQSIKKKKSLARPINSEFV